MHKIKFLLLSGVLTLFSIQCSTSQFVNYVTRKEDKVYDGEKEIRFISFNIPNLHYNEDYMPFNNTNVWRLPDEFEIRDALLSIMQLGGKVARIYVPSLRKKDEPKEYFRHVEAPGVFNEEAFKSLDKVLEVANKVGVRIIIPLVDNWWWWGGPMDYAAFRGKKPNEFWSDSLLISDYKKTIHYILTRKNSYTGTIYSEDKAIFAWETGNELQAPFTWTKDIAAYMKSIDSNHLILEGINGRELTEAAIEDPNLDILSTHYTPIPGIISNQKLVQGKKPYLIGEYGLMPFNMIQAVTDTIINNGLLGGMIWSLRNRNRDGGFYFHFERGTFDSYHYPGFSSGDPYEENRLFSLIKEKAAQIAGEPVTPMRIPEAPVLLDIKNVSEISWRGTVGSRFYSIERKEEFETDWKIIADSVDETKYQYKPLFCDETAELGKRYYYRVNAENEAGSSEYSNVIGPVDVFTKKNIDEFENFEKIYQRSDELKLVTFEDLRKTREDRSRLTGKDSSFVIYQVPGKVVGITIETFLPNEKSGVEVSASVDGNTYSQIELSSQNFIFPKNDYGFFPALRHKSDVNLYGKNYFKILLIRDVQLSRLEIEYK